MITVKIANTVDDKRQDSHLKHFKPVPFSPPPNHHIQSPSPLLRMDIIARKHPKELDSSHPKKKRDEKKRILSQSKLFETPKCHSTSHPEFEGPVSVSLSSAFTQRSCTVLITAIPMTLQLLRLVSSPVLLSCSLLLLVMMRLG